MDTKNLTYEEALQITQEFTEAKGYTLLGVKPLTAHPDDKYLTVVLVNRHTQVQPFVTWICNVTDPSFNTGVYFTELKDALERFNKRD